MSLRSSSATKEARALLQGTHIFLLLLTIMIGGLLVRRRAKAAIWIGSILLVASAADHVIYRQAMRVFEQGSGAMEVYPWLLYLHLGYLVCLVGSLVAAIACLLLRAKASQRSTARSLVAALTVSAVALFVAFRVAPEALTDTRIILRQDGYPNVQGLSDEQYDTITFFQSLTAKDPDLWRGPALPILLGSGEIHGLVTHNGKPADVSVRLFIDGFWRTRTVRTGASGQFTLQAPARLVTINRIDLTWWFNKPVDGRLYMPILRRPLTPFEDATFDSAEYSRLIEIDAAADDLAPQIELEIVAFMETIWPQWGKTDQVGHPDQDAIAWTPLPGAAYYDVIFGRYLSNSGRYQSDAATYIINASALLHHRLRSEDATVPLDSLPLIPSAERQSFYLTVYAFDAEDRFIGASRSAFSDMSFSIAGYTIEGNLPSSCCQKK